MTYLPTQTASFYRENSGTLSVVSNGNFFAIGNANPPCFSYNSKTHAPPGISYICARLDGDADSTHPLATLSLSPPISSSNSRIGSSLTQNRLETVQSNSTAIVPTRGTLSVVATNRDTGDQILTSNFLFLHLICR